MRLFKAVGHVYIVQLNLNELDICVCLFKMPVSSTCTGEW